MGGEPLRPGECAGSRDLQAVVMPFAALPFSGLRGTPMPVLRHLKMAVVERLLACASMVLWAVLPLAADSDQAWAGQQDSGVAAVSTSHALGSQDPAAPGRLERTLSVQASDGVRLAVRVRGHGPTCLCPSPGDGIGSDLYARTLGPLEGIFTMAYLDARGSGASGRPEEDRGYRLSSFVQDLEAVRVALAQERVWIFGHDEGGMQAIGFATDYSDHCAGLILVAAHADEGAAWSERMIERYRRKRWKLVDEMGWPWVNENVGTSPEDSHCTDDGLKAETLSELPILFHSQASRQAHLELFRQQRYAFSAWRGLANNKESWDVTGSPRDVRAPTLIVIGLEDPVSAVPEGEELHLGIANSKLLSIEEAGHYPWLEQPERFFSALERGLRALVPDIVSRPDSQPASRSTAN